MEPNFISEDKVIITAAITGGIHGKWANAALPITPEEQAQDARDCYNAGATVLHLHVRGDDGQNTPDLRVYNKAVRLIGEACPIIRQIGNGIGARIDISQEGLAEMMKSAETEGVNFSDYIKLHQIELKKHIRIAHASLEERLNLLNIDPQPEMHTINAGTFEFRTAYGFGITFDNPVSFNEDYIRGCQEKGFGIEIEVYDSGQIENVKEMIATGLLKPPYHFSIVLGIQGGAPATAQNLLHLISQIPEKSSWQVVTVGKFNLRTTIAAMAMGGNVRTGLEDIISYHKGEPVKNNAQLVERMVRIAREMGREVATLEETRAMLGL